MTSKTLLSSPEATTAFAKRLAAELTPGDTLLLEGQLGSGKSHFARSVIHALQANAGQPPEDVPSPTFTLVQTYVAARLKFGTPISIALRRRMKCSNWA